MDRRHCIRLCAGGVAGGALARAWPAFAGPIEDFAPAQLIKEDGAPLAASEVPIGEAMVFAYPYRGIPCFLVNLGEERPHTLDLVSPEDGAYTNPGAVGKSGSLVAFVAICTHQLSHPTPDFSPLRYAASGSDLAGARGRIVCCSHGSVYDPASGAKNLAGPAQYPLMPVRIAYDAGTDGLSATGTVGKTFFAKFFASFKADLIKQFGPGQYSRDVGSTTEVVPLSRYSATVSDC